jgi:hypothetical protein
VFNRVLGFEGLAQCCKRSVLGRLEGIALQPFQLYAYGVVVAVVLPLPAGLAGMPGAPVAIYKLYDLACAADEVVCRHFNPAYGLEVGVGVPIERVGEELFNLRPTVLAWGQADGMDDQQVDSYSGGAGAVVR